MHRKVVVEEEDKTRLCNSCEPLLVVVGLGFVSYIKNSSHDLR